MSHKLQWRSLKYQAVTDFLTNHHRDSGYTVNEVADAMGYSRHCVAYILPRLYEDGIVAKATMPRTDTERTRKVYALAKFIKEQA